MLLFQKISFFFRKLSYIQRRIYCQQLPKSDSKESEYYIFNNPLHEQSPEDDKVFKCSLCFFTTQYSSCLRRHKQWHTNSVEIAKFKCDQCSCTPSNQHNLNSHKLLVHGSIENLPSFKCEHCSFVSKYKRSLNRHVKVHKNYNEGRVFKCHHCMFETRNISEYKMHVQMHFSNIKICKYGQCSYTTKFMHHLKTHILSHVRMENTPMFKCYHCSFVSKYKTSLINHLAIHKKDLFKCYHCPFATKYKSCLKKHVSHCSLVSNMFRHI